MIVLTATLPFNKGSETITFTLNNLLECDTSENAISITGTNDKEIKLKHDFVTSTDGLIPSSDDAATKYLTCNTVPYYFEIQVNSISFFN